MRPAGVLFDCDGVIVDSEGAAIAIMQDEARAHGIEMSADEIRRRFVGGTIQSTHAELRRLGMPLDGDWVDRFYERLYASLAAGTALIDGIEDLLDRLDAAGIPYAIGSNGRMTKMEITLGQHPALMARFGDRIFSGQDMGCPKPDPALWLHCAGALGLPPDSCAVIDDSPSGVLGAVRAGIPVFGFAEHDDGAALADLGARVFHRMGDLRALWGL